MSKKLMKKVLSLALALMIVVAGVISTPAYVEAAAAKPTSITLNTKSRTMFVNQKFRLRVSTVRPKGASTAVRFTSNKTNIASVNRSTGEITAKRVGKATITATSTANSRVRANCSITVRQRASSVTLNRSAVSLKRNSKLNLKATVRPASTSNKSVKWSSSKTSVASVSNKGVVTARKNGTATITATTADGSRLKATCVVGVYTDRVKSATINISSRTVNVGDTLKLSIKSTNPRAASKVFTWRSGSTRVATVGASTGTVKAIAKGTATITGTATDGSRKTVTCRLTVRQPVTKVVINGSTADITVRETTTLSANATPTTANNRAVNWTSSATSIATVSSRGVVTGVKAGTAKITATAADGSRRSASVNIRVLPRVSSVGLNKKTLSLVVDGSETLTTNVLPTNAKYKNVTWKSSNSNVVSVDSKGKVTALKVTTSPVTITATADGKEEFCLVTVTSGSVKATGVKFNNDTMYVDKGDPAVALRDEVTVSPTSTVNDYKLSWKSSNSDIVSVNEDTGVMTIKEAGIATITVKDTVTDLPATTSTCVIHVLGNRRAVVSLEGIYNYTLYRNATRFELYDEYSETPKNLTPETAELNHTKIKSKITAFYNSNVDANSGELSNTLLGDKWENKSNKEFEDLLDSYGITTLLSAFGVRDITIDTDGDAKVITAGERTYYLTLKEQNELTPSGKYNLTVVQKKEGLDPITVEITDLELTYDSDTQCFVSKMAIGVNKDEVEISASLNGKSLEVKDVTGEGAKVITAVETEETYNIMINNIYLKRMLDKFKINNKLSDVTVENVYDAPVTTN